MSFEDKIKIFSSKIPDKLEHIETEETTKTSLILPFLNEVMGYDTTDPTEVKAEYHADIGSKKGEKIDLAILNDDSEIMLIECKSLNTILTTKHLSQLYRYFNITDTELGILTNGVIYKFYTDSVKPGKMDKSPFMEINLIDLSEKDILLLKKFSKENFNISKIKSKADNLKYAYDIHQLISKEIEAPSDDFVRLFAKQAYDGKINANVKNKFYKIIKNEFKEVIDEKFENSINIPSTENFNKIKSYEGNRYRYPFNDEYDIIITVSQTGTKNRYEFIKKDSDTVRVSIDCDDLPFDDSYLYLYSNGNLPFYKTSEKVQGWYTVGTKRTEIKGNIQILDFYGNNILVRDFDEGKYYFIDEKKKIV